VINSPPAHFLYKYILTIFQNTTANRSLRPYHRATIAAGTANLSEEHECFVDHCLSYCAFSSDNCFVWRLTSDF
jgi:hypothetical protein